ncbi:MAG: T9SS C-terminal target domain-containing protein, partial [Bacteroidetes bacterium]
QTTQTATGLTVGSYHVVVTDANGCTSEAEVVVDKAVQSSEVGFEWIFNVNPNPSSGFVYVEMDLKNREDWVLKVLDSAGKVVNEYKAPKGGSSKADLVIDDLQSGIYHVMLQVGDDIVSRKLVIQK